MDAIDVKGLPENEAQLIQQLIDLLEEKQALSEPENQKNKGKFYQRVREMQEQAKGLHSKDVDKAITEAVEAVKKQVRM